MSDIGIVLMVGIGTLAFRSSLAAFLGSVAVPQWLTDGLRLVAPAVLAGLVVQGVVFDGDDLRSMGSWYLAAVAAGLVAWRTKSITWTLVSGMAAVWLLELFL